MPKQHNALFRALPAMNAVLDALEGPEHAARFTSLPRPVLRECVEDFLDGCRADIASNAVTTAQELALSALLPRIAVHIMGSSRPHLRRVINATGVIIHTNLGRSLLAPEAVEAVREAAAAYSNLEFDLDTGSRGSRHSHVESLICRLTGAEAALAVN